MDDNAPVDAGWLESEGWDRIGNTWYPSGWSGQPAVMFVEVDGTFRVFWHRPTRGDVRRLVEFVGAIRPAPRCGACGWPARKDGTCTRDGCCNSD